MAGRVQSFSTAWRKLQESEVVHMIRKERVKMGGQVTHSLNCSLSMSYFGLAIRRWPLGRGLRTAHSRVLQRYPFLPRSKAEPVLTARVVTPSLVFASIPRPSPALSNPDTARRPHLQNGPGTPDPAPGSWPAAPPFLSSRSTATTRPPRISVEPPGSIRAGSRS
jgi:hypothetical protein